MSYETALPDSLHLLTYDMRGTIVDTGQPKDVRQTGIVTQSHQLMNGFAEFHPDLRLAVTQTGAAKAFRYQLLTPEGQTVLAQGIETGFPKYLADPKTGGKDRYLVRHYYEDMIMDPDNPVYRSLAQQYSRVVRTANIPNLLLQNPNPLMGILKAEELGYLDPVTARQLNATGIIHDVEGYSRRLKYVSDRMEQTNMNLKLLTGSTFAYRQLGEIGMAEDNTYMVSNGMDIAGFVSALERVTAEGVFETVRTRNGLPEIGEMIIVPARRVEHKGHLDVIKAVKSLKDAGKFEDKYVVFTGDDMLNTQSLGFEAELSRQIVENQLKDTIYMLDYLSADEVIACYGASTLSILASTEPEGFAYANIEAMLARVPVITTRLGGPLDYIRPEETGLFVEPHDPISIAAAIDKLSTNPSLYEHIAERGKQEACKYTVEQMAHGYAEVISAGRPAQPFSFNLGLVFEKIGEGMHTEVYTPKTESDFVIQVFKKHIHELSLEEINQDYEYLKKAYAAMPGLIPDQHLATLSEELHESALIKEFVISDSGRNTLRLLTAEELAAKTLQQVKTFIMITKDLLARVSSSPALSEFDVRLPDIIDPEFENLLIDVDGNLKLVDTNRLIGTRHLKKLVVSGEKLNINERPIYALFFRRLLYLEAAFMRTTPDMLRQDPLYARYIDQKDFNELFLQSHAAGEAIVKKTTLVSVA